MTRITSTIASFGFAATALAAHAPQVRDGARAVESSRPGTGSIAGTIVSDETPPRPIRRATVSISEDLSLRGGRLATTDDAGRYEFSGLPAGRYLVSAVKPPYLRTAYGATRPSRPGSDRTGTAIALGDGTRVDHADMRMTRSGVITGIVRDASGHPMRYVRIVIYYARAAPATGERTLVSFSPMDSPESTDSRGVYRMYGLPPGDYLVAAFPPSRDSTNLEILSDADLPRLVGPQRPAASAPGNTSSQTPPRRPTMGYAPVFYPGTSVAADATFVTLASAEERTGLDFIMRLVPNALVTGTVTRADGRPAARATLQLEVPTLQTTVPLSATADDAGRFVIRGVAPGTYRIRARSSIAGATGGAASTMWGEDSVVVQSADVAVSVGVQPDITVTGIVRVDPASTGVPDLARVRLAFRHELITRGLLPPINGAIDPVGTFTVGGLPPGAWRVAATGLPAGWLLGSVTSAGEDVLDRGFTARIGAPGPELDVIVTNRVSEITGAITDAGGRPAPEYFIIVFPADEALWTWQSRRILQTRPAHDGRYSLKGLPAGDYLLAAVTDVDDLEWFDPSFLRALRNSAVRIPIVSGEKKTTNLQVR